MISSRIAYTAFVAFVSAVLTLIVVNLVQGSPEQLTVANSASPDSPVYTVDQVAAHNNASSCWKIIEGGVYDLTEYLPNHPTDEETFARWCGREATSAWQDQGNGRAHSPRAAARLENYRIGTIEATPAASGPAEASPATVTTIATTPDHRLGQMMLGLAPGTYLDGTYRGNFSDRGQMQVGLQFKLERGALRDISYRHLYYQGQNYLELVEGADKYPVLRQYQQAAKWLEGQPLSAIFRLYDPKDVVEDIDGYSGATLRGNKVISAFRDGLNRGVYSW